MADMPTDRWENNTDLVHRKSYITEGATCHYTWYVPQNIPGLIDVMGGQSGPSSPNSTRCSQKALLAWQRALPSGALALLNGWSAREDAPLGTSYPGHGVQRHPRRPLWQRRCRPDVGMAGLCHDGLLSRLSGNDDLPCRAAHASNVLCFAHGRIPTCSLPIL